MEESVVNFADLPPSSKKRRDKLGRLRLVLRIVKKTDEKEAAAAGGCRWRQQPWSPAIPVDDGRHLGGIATGAVANRRRKGHLSNSPTIRSYHTSYRMLLPVGLPKIYLILKFSKTHYGEDKTVKSSKKVEASSLGCFFCQ